MNPQDCRPSSTFRYFVIGVLGFAVVLGTYFVQLNARMDREREDAAEHLALCREVDSASLAATGKIERSQACERLINRYSPQPLEPR
ncbi:MAG: hypothetical protein GAK37_03242 [Pseudomonas sp.]|nr:MAG: hypothetical protein GAK37_03242 [Pseudomonas sp.]